MPCQDRKRRQSELWQGRDVGLRMVMHALADEESDAPGRRVTGRLRSYGYAPTVAASRTSTDSNRSAVR